MAPAYKVIGTCANCNTVFAVLMNGKALSREESQIPTVLASCTCLVAAYAEEQVRSLLQLDKDAHEESPTSLPQDHDMSDTAVSVEDRIAEENV